MNMEMEKSLKAYYREVARALPKNGRETLLPDIKAGVDSFLAENPAASIEDVISYVGTPECIANEYYANQDGTKITKKINASKVILISVVSVVFATLLVFIVFMLYSVIREVLSTPSYAITERAVVVSRFDLP